MKARHLAIAALAASVCGCAHVHKIDRNSPPSLFRLVNMTNKGERGRITLTNGRTDIGDYAEVARDSTFWFEPGTGRKHCVDTSEVSRIDIVKRKRGAWEGAAIGAALGIPVGAVWGTSQTYQRELSKIEKAGIGALNGLCYGALIGAPVGVLLGSKDRYVLVGPVSRSSDQSDRPPQK